MKNKFLMSVFAVFFLVVLCGGISAVPVVNLISPSDNYTCNTTNSLHFYFNLTDSSASSVNCTLFWDAGSQNFSNVPFNGSSIDAGYLNGLSNGVMYWWVSCINDLDQPGESGNRALLVNITPSGPINVTLISPINNQTITGSSFNYTYQVNLDANCSVYGDLGAGWGNKTFEIENTANARWTVNVPDVTSSLNGAHIWNVYCYELANISNAGWAVSNATYTINVGAASSPINVTLKSPCFLPTDPVLE